MGSMGGRRLGAVLGAVGLGLAVALTGCSAGPENNSAGRPAGDAAANKQAGAGQPAAQPGQQGQEGQQGQAGAPADLRVDQRSIIYTGSMTVRVADVDKTAAEAASIVTGAGGFVGGDKRTSDATRSEATLELRVPAAKFGAVVDEIAALGKQERRDISTQDVTEESLDLDARITSQRARVDSGRRLLAQAKTLNDLVMLEGELAKREADLASLEAKKRHLDDLTALSTITALLLGPDAQESSGGSRTGFLAGLKAGWQAFVASLQVLLTILGALLPWLVALGVPVLGVMSLVRRFGRRARVGETPLASPARAPASPETQAGPS